MTMQDDFEEFLKYSDNQKQHVDIRSLAWKAFEAGRDKGATLASMYLMSRNVASRNTLPLIHYDEMYKLAYELAPDRVRSGCMEPEQAFMGANGEALTSANPGATTQPGGMDDGVYRVDGGPAETGKPGTAHFTPLTPLSFDELDKQQ